MAEKYRPIHTDRSSRALRRSLRGEGGKGVDKPKSHARLTGRTGSSDHWLGKVQRTNALKATLGRMRTADHMTLCPEAAFVAEEYPTLLALSEAAYSDLLKLKGVGPARLRKLRAYMSKNNVLCQWKVPV